MSRISFDSEVEGGETLDQDDDIPPVLKVSASTRIEYAYMIIVPDPLEGHFGIYQDKLLTNWDKVYWIKIGDGKDITARASQYPNPSQFITIIKIGGRPQSEYGPGKHLESAVFSRHRMGGIFREIEQHPSEWHALYTSTEAVRMRLYAEGLITMLAGFFPYSPHSNKAQQKSELESNNVPAYKWKSIVNYIKYSTQRNTGSSIAPLPQVEPEVFPMVYIVATPSTHKESKNLGVARNIIKTAQGDATYWVKIGYACTQHNTPLRLISSKFLTEIPDLSFNGFHLDRSFIEDRTEGIQEAQRIAGVLIKNLKSRFKGITVSDKQNHDWLPIHISFGDETRTVISFLDKYIRTFDTTKGNPKDLVRDPPQPRSIIQNRQDFPTQQAVADRVQRKFLRKNERKRLKTRDDLWEEQETQRREQEKAIGLQISFGGQGG
ncbi:unnamed protein product [Rhizoctonia solani]|uniref:Uncharacterized protein n=1 Tax=Rhizoctonia solani TaxID=456999 RepID=A0A8H2Y044_9AGAM|nr:unnamed protein product [Rhizoctonia solani]